MSPVLAARIGRIGEEEAKGIVRDSRLSLNEKFLKERLYGWVPLPASIKPEDDKIVIEVDNLPRVSKDEERPFRQQKVEFSLREKIYDVYSLHMCEGEDGGSYRYMTDLVMDESILGRLKDMGTNDYCAILDIKSNMLIGLLSESGEYINFTGHIEERERTRSVREVLESGIKALLEQDTRKETGPDKKPPPAKTDYLSKKLKNKEIAEMLGISSTAVSVDISQGYLRGKSVADVTERIFRMRRRTGEQKVRMLNLLYHGVEQFSNIENAYAVLTDVYNLRLEEHKEPGGLKDVKKKRVYRHRTGRKG